MEQPESHETTDGVNRRSLLAGVGGLLAAGGVASALAPSATADPAALPERNPRVEDLLKKMTLAEKLGQLAALFGGL